MGETIYKGFPGGQRHAQRYLRGNMLSYGPFPFLSLLKCTSSASYNNNNNNNNTNSNLIHRSSIAQLAQQFPPQKRSLFLAVIICSLRRYRSVRENSEEKCDASCWWCFELMERSTQLWCTLDNNNAELWRS